MSCTVTWTKYEAASLAKAPFRCHLLEDAEAVVRELRDDVRVVLLVQGFSPSQEIFQVFARNAFLGI